jgi:hypothetical protein
MAADLSPPGRIILTATALNGDALALVSYPDGSCCITREGKPVPDSNCKPGDMVESTKLLLKLAQTL